MHGVAGGRCLCLRPRRKGNCRLAQMLGGGVGRNIITSEDAFETMFAHRRTSHLSCMCSVTQSFKRLHRRPLARQGLLAHVGLESVEPGPLRRCRCSGVFWCVPSHVHISSMAAALCLAGSAGYCACSPSSMPSFSSAAVAWAAADVGLHPATTIVLHLSPSSLGFLPSAFQSFAATLVLAASSAISWAVLASALAALSALGGLPFSTSSQVCAAASLADCCAATASKHKQASNDQPAAKPLPHASPMGNMRTSSVLSQFTVRELVLNEAQASAGTAPLQLSSASSQLILPSDMSH